MIVVCYYIYALIDMFIAGVGGLILLPVVTFLLWLVPTVVAMLPPVGRAMRRSGPGGYPPGYGQKPMPDYGPGY